MNHALLHAQLAELCSREASSLAGRDPTEETAARYFWLVDLAKANDQAASVLGHQGDPFAGIGEDYRTCPRCGRAQHWSELKPLAPRSISWDRISGERLEYANTCCGGTCARELSPVIVRSEARRVAA